MAIYTYDDSGNTAALTVRVPVAPEIKQPVKQVAELNHMASFSVTVSDASGISFQWKFNGTDIPSATGDSLLLPNVSAANEGQYSVVVTNSAGSMTSAPAELMLDSDGDGLPDSWENTNFGDTTSQRSEGDPDKDNISNFDEFSDGTNPTSATSLRPQLTAYSDVGGTVAVSPMKLSYDPGEVVTLTATPFAPSVFAGWMGDLNGTSNPATITMDDNKTVRTRFASAISLPSELIAFWRGETDANDLIGGHDGTFFADTSPTAAPTTPSITSSGKVGGAFDFDGTVHVRVPHSADLTPAQITVECWVYPTVQNNTDQTIITREVVGQDNPTWSLGVRGGRPHFWTFLSSDLVAPVEIPLNQWTHLAASFDGKTKRLYINGAQLASQGGMGPLVYSESVPVTIGSCGSASASRTGFSGRVDEVAIYSRALSLNEVADLFNADLAGRNVTQPYFTSPSRLPDVALGVSYSQQLTTILGLAPIIFSTSSGALPPGMTLSSVGVVSGLPAAPGLYDFTILATDATGNFTEHLCLLRVLQPVTRPVDLMAWWRGEPGAGNVVADIIGGHDGGFFSGSTPVAPALTTDGKVGSALTFDGNLHVRIPDAVELRPAEITVEAWIFPTAREDNDQTVVARGSSVDAQEAWWIGLRALKPLFRSKHSGGVVSLEAPAIPLNQWTHLAISFDGTTKRLYVNGEQASFQDGLTALVYDASAAPVTIGSDWVTNASEFFFRGRVDEVSLYRRALSSAEIFGIADVGSAGKSIIGI